jgi:hypothetical protein
MDINNLIKKASEQQINLIEEKIKELIKPYINTNYYNAIAIKGDLERKGYKLGCFTENNISEYRITYMPSGKYDYFIMKDGEMENHGFNFSIKTYISDIVRGIEGKNE